MDIHLKVPIICMRIRALTMLVLISSEREQLQQSPLNFMNVAESTCNASSALFSVVSKRPVHAFYFNSLFGTWCALTALITPHMNWKVILWLDAHAQMIYITITQAASYNHRCPLQRHTLWSSEYFHQSTQQMTVYKSFLL